MAAKPWVKGQSGNPAGRPRGVLSLTAMLRRILREPGEDGRIHAERIVRRVVEIAEGEDVTAALSAFKLLIERTDGAVTANVSVNLPRLPDLQRLSDTELDDLVRTAGAR